MAWFPVPPHVFAGPAGKPPTGPTIALFEAIAARMGRAVEWVGPIPINRLGDYQKTGGMSLDGTILHIKTPAVIDLLYYPSHPYFVARPCLAVRSDNPLPSIRTIDDIKGYRIGFIKTLSSNYPAFIADHRDVLVIDELSGEGWVSRNLQKLLSGRLDAVYERNQYTLPYQAAIDGVQAKIKVLLLPVDPIPHYFVFHRSSPRAAELLRRYESAVAGWDFDYDAMVQAELRRLGL
jgi:ABC-type amino acid transport substrate-binding protein